MTKIELFLLLLQRILLVLLHHHPLQDHRGEVGNDDVSTGSSHRHQHLHQRRLEVEGTGRGSVVKHCKLPGYLLTIKMLASYR